MSSRHTDCVAATILGAVERLICSLQQLVGALPVVRAHGNPELVRRFVCQALEKLGYQVVEAPDALVAQALFEERGSSIDLLLSDVVMPRMDGLELAARLQTRRPELRTLLMSGHSAALTDGGRPARAHFLQKPFGIDELSEAIRKVLDR